MKKIKSFSVSRGWLLATGATKAEAKASLEPMIDWACNHPSATIEMRFGQIIVLSANPAGWQYSIVRSGELQHGQQYHTSCGFGQIDRMEALLSARLHCAQSAWAADKDDQEHVKASGLDAEHEREMWKWIRFQRDYQSALASGHDANMAWRIAGRDPSLPRAA